MENIKFDLTDDWYIKRIDDRNVAICRDRVSKKGLTYAEYDGYYSTYEAAWRGAVTKLQLKPENFSELISVIERLEKISNANPLIGK